MSTENARLVRSFCDAFTRRDTDEILAYFTEDAVYHNIPMPAMTGKPAIRTVLQVNVEDAMRADVIFSELMGEEVQPRKKFIQSHYDKVRVLDI